MAIGTDRNAFRNLSEDCLLRTAFTNHRCDRGFLRFASFMVEIHDRWAIGEILSTDRTTEILLHIEYPAEVQLMIPALCGILLRFRLPLSVVQPAVAVGAYGDALRNFG